MRITKQKNLFNNVSWRYKTSGHYMDICAATRDNGELTAVEFCDTHPTYPDKNYARSVALAYKANYDHFRKAMIW